MTAASRRREIPPDDPGLRAIAAELLEGHELGGSGVVVHRVDLVDGDDLFWIAFTSASAEAETAIVSGLPDEWIVLRVLPGWPVPRVAGELQSA